MDEFKVRAYSKQELAMAYFPTAENSHTAVNRLMSWVNRCTPLCRELQEQGYRKTSKWFTAPQVQLIVDYLGEP